MNKIFVYFIGAIVLITSVVILIPLVQNFQNTRPVQLFSQDSSLQIINTPTTHQNTPLIVYGYLPYWTKNKAFFSPVITHVSYFSLGIQADGKLLNLPSKSQEAGYEMTSRWKKS